MLGGGAPKRHADGRCAGGICRATGRIRCDFHFWRRSLIGLLYGAKAGQCGAGAGARAKWGWRICCIALSRSTLVFNKPGSAADVYRDLLASNPFVQQVLAHSNNSTLTRLAADWLQLWATPLSE